MESKSVFVLISYDMTDTYLVSRNYTKQGTLAMGFRCRNDLHHECFGRLSTTSALCAACNTRMSHTSIYVHGQEGLAKANASKAALEAINPTKLLKVPCPTDVRLTHGWTLPDAEIRFKFRFRCYSPVPESIFLLNGGMIGSITAITRPKSSNTNLSARFLGRA